MKKLILALAIMTVTSAGTAMAQDGPTHQNGAIGFHNVEAPLGIRWWFSGQKAGIDLGFGFANFPGDEDPDENVNSFAIDAGLIYRFKSWERVHILGRLGLLYQSEEYQVFIPPATITPIIPPWLAMPPRLIWRTPHQGKASSNFHRRGRS